jgi:hypothetical protein
MSTVQEMQHNLYLELEQEGPLKSPTNDEEYLEFFKKQKIRKAKTFPGMYQNNCDNSGNCFDFFMHFYTEHLHHTQEDIYDIFNKYRVDIMGIGRFRGDNLKNDDGSDTCTYRISSFMEERYNIINLYTDNKIDGKISVLSRDEEDMKKYGYNFIDLNNIV